MIPVSLTQIHIRNGRPRMVCECPVTLAVRDSVLKEIEGKHYNLVYVGAGMSLIQIEFVDLQTGYLWRRVCPSPASVTEFMEKFDNGKSVEPFDFELEGGELVQIS